MTIAVCVKGRRQVLDDILRGGMVLACVALLGLGLSATAQQPDFPAAPAAAAPAAPPAAAPAAPPAAPPAVPAATPAAPAAAKAKGPTSSEETVTTRDGVQIVFSYLPSTIGKEAVPVVLLHMHKGSRKDYKDLALFLQSKGHAVIVPDLRGHGASTKTASGVALTPNNVDFVAMATQDLESLKSFLVAKNNKEELNIEKLCVVGAEMGATVACVWAAIDWSWPILATGKQGQDVKALVLLTPKQTFKRLKLQDAFNRSAAVAAKIAVLLCVGRDKSDLLNETERIHAIFKRGHPEPTNKEDRDLFLGRLPTTLQGTNLLTVKQLNLDALIEQFIDVRLVKQPMPWKFRATPQ